MFLAYASIILVALLISLTASVTSFVLRETIAHRFSKTDVTAQLNGYATDPFLRSRWDTIQKEFRCCGGYNVGTGYTDWEGVSIEPLPIGANPAALVTGKLFVYNISCLFTIYCLFIMLDTCFHVSCAFTMSAVCLPRHLLIYNVSCFFCQLFVFNVSCLFTISAV